MGIGRSTFYDTPDARARDLTIVAEMKMICDEFEAYGYLRVDAELRHRGVVVNAKKIRRLMREHALEADGVKDYMSDPCSVAEIAGLWSAIEKSVKVIHGARDKAAMHRVAA